MLDMECGIGLVLSLRMVRRGWDINYGEERDVSSMELALNAAVTVVEGGDAKL